MILETMIDCVEKQNLMSTAVPRYLQYQQKCLISEH